MWQIQRQAERLREAGIGQQVLLLARRLRGLVQSRQIRLELRRLGRRRDDADPHCRGEPACGEAEVERAVIHEPAHGMWISDQAVACLRREQQVQLAQVKTLV